MNFKKGEEKKLTEKKYQKKKKRKDMSETIPVSVQCCEGRFELSVDSNHTLRDVLRQFKREVAALDPINLEEYVVNHEGKLLLDDSVTLQTVGVKKDSVFVLVRKACCPAASPEKDEDDM